MISAKEAAKLSTIAERGENFQEDFENFIELMEDEIIRCASLGYYEAKLAYVYSDAIPGWQFYNVDVSDFPDLGQAERYVEKMFLEVKDLLDKSDYDRNFQSKIIETEEGFVCEYELTIIWKDSKILVI